MKFSLKTFFYFFLLSIFIFIFSFEQELGLEELLSQEVNVATQKSLSVRETAGIVTVITKEEIEKSGAKDLVDILNLIPGFFFGADVSQTVSLGVRGVWANEGKILLLFDGHEMNELTYSNIILGNHISPEIIEKIEIIRGPGSVKYGGFAELGVINIVTKREDDNDFLKTDIIYSSFGKIYSKRGGVVSFNKNFSSFNIGGSFSYNQSIRSVKTYYDMYDDSFSMSSNSKIFPFNGRLNFSFKNFEVNLMVDRYDMTIRSVYDYILPKSVYQKFDYYFTDVKYRLDLNEKIKVSPTLKYKLQYPWQITDTSSSIAENYWNLKAERILENISLNYEHSKDILLMVGEEYYYERCIANDSLQVDFADGTRKIVNQNLSIFTELFYKIPKVDLISISGFRFEYNKLYGKFLVPRIGFTRVFNKFHLKLLYAHSFRSPSFMNVNGNVNILPEKTKTFEIEVGYMITPEMFVAGNLFDINILSPIVYYFDEETFFEGYFNDTRIGSRGFELEYRVKKGKVDIKLNYSYYTANKNEVELYSVPVDEKLFLGAPRHKIGFAGTFNLLSNLYFNINGTYQSSKYAYYKYEENIDDFVFKSFDPDFLVNFNLTYKDFLLKNMSFSFFIKNILNTSYYFVQPYNGGFAPMPGLDREFGLKITYCFCK
ncbi:MAG: TonB-dependent receptor plug domain-containing protein [candidate division WOR-3 bacterium]